MPNGCFTNNRKDAVATNKQKDRSSMMKGKTKIHSEFLWYAVYNMYNPCYLICKCFCQLM